MGFANRLSCVVVAVLASCSTSHEGDEPDAGMLTVDTGVPHDDAGVDAGSDAGSPVRRDSGPGEDDACTGAWASRCDSLYRIARCHATGPVTREFVYEDCVDDLICQEVGGDPACVCREGMSRCTSGTTAERCESGEWVSMSCETSCSATVAGDVCDSEELALGTLHAQVNYEKHSVDRELRNWDPDVEVVPAREFVVLSFRRAALLDAQITDAEGAFTIQVPESPEDGDVIDIVAADVNSENELGLAVADSHRVWQWAFATSDIDEGEDLLIEEDNGASAAHVYDLIQHARGEVSAVYGEDPNKIVVWLNEDEVPDCGACFLDWEDDSIGLHFDHQIAFPGDDDEEYWSDAVILHEYGHHVMSWQGIAMNEAGPHYTTYPVNPGMAWSEGWASYLSSSLRDSPLYYDKQDGDFFWLNIGARTTSDHLDWWTIEADEGLTQLMLEFNVSRMLWLLEDQVGGRAQVWSAMSEVTPGRGYTARYWSNPNYPNVYSDTGEPQSYVADFFDAVLCGDHATADDVDAVTLPDEEYPYPSDSPICADIESKPLDSLHAELKGPDKPGRGPIGLTFTVERHAPIDMPLEIRVEAPHGVRVLDRANRGWTLAPNQSATTDAFVLRVASTSGEWPREPLRVVIDGRTPYAGHHGEYEYRFGREAPLRGNRLHLTDGAVHLNGLNLGRAVKVR